MFICLEYEYVTETDQIHCDILKGFFIFLVKRVWPCLNWGEAVSAMVMQIVFDLDDRARLRERFYGATHTVLARA